MMIILVMMVIVMMSVEHSVNMLYGLKIETSKGAGYDLMGP